MRTLFHCVLLLTLAHALGWSQDKASKGGGNNTPAMPFALTSAAWPDGTDIPAKYTQLAGDRVVSPKLDWTNVPENTQSFVLLMHDPDVSRDHTTDDQTHWIAWNIPAGARGLPENVPTQPTLPDGTVQGRNGANSIGYRGPGAPATTPKHHYTIELFALDTKLDLGPETPRSDVFKALNGHILAKAIYVGLFHRPN